MNNIVSITGNTRSGTTLLEKLISRVHGFEMLSQPFPQLFIAAKQQMHKEFSHPENRLVHSNFYQNDIYAPSDVTGYFEEQKFESSFILKALSRGYSGQLTSGVIEKAQSISTSGNLAEVYKNLIKNITLDSSSHIGAKHIMIEEFTQHFINSDIKVIIIVRDPRDMIVSAKFGKSKEFVGSTLPLLFELRNWRKSAEYVLRYRGEENFYWLRYEDLVMNPTRTLQGVIKFIRGSDSVEPDINKAINSEGITSNSSFDIGSGISTESVGKYTQYLSVEHEQYIATICGYEMEYLGYNSQATESPSKVINSFSEPLAVSSSAIDPLYSSDLKRREFELERCIAPTPNHFCFLENYRELIEKV